MAKDKSAIDFEDSRYYINRELSWLQFNERVLSEAEDESNPLFERLKASELLAGEHDGACVLYGKDEEVKRLVL